MQAVRQLDTESRAILCIVGGMAVITVQDVIIKSISGDYPLHQIMFGRAVVALLCTIVIARLEGSIRFFRTRRPWLHIVRGMLMVVANLSFFLALAALPLAETTAIFFVAPLLITALSVPILGERVGIRRWLAVLAGMAGVVVMVRPGAELFELAALLPILAAVCYALMQMMTRRLGVTDRASTLAFYVHLNFIVVSGGIGLALGDGRFAGGGHPSLEFLLRAWLWPDLEGALLIFSCGLISSVAAYFMTQAYRLGEANKVAPFEYTALPLAVLWGVLVFGHRPDSYALTGIALILGSGLYVFYRETVRAATGRPPARG